MQADLDAGKYEAGSVEHCIAFDSSLIKEIQREHSWDRAGRIKWTITAAIGAPASAVLWFGIFNVISGGQLLSEIPESIRANVCGSGLFVVMLLGLSAGIRRGLTPGPLPGVELPGRESYKEKVYS